MRTIVAFCALHHRCLVRISIDSACHDAAFAATGLAKTVAPDVSATLVAATSAALPRYPSRISVRCPLHWMDLS
jgi:hypothetical protein